VAWTRHLSQITRRSLGVAIRGRNAVSTGWPASREMPKSGSQHKASPPPRSSGAQRTDTAAWAGFPRRMHLVCAIGVIWLVLSSKGTCLVLFEFIYL